MRRKLLIGIVALIIVSAIAVPSIILTQKVGESEKRVQELEQQAKEQMATVELAELYSSFLSQYGSEAQIQQVISPDDIRLYLVSWLNDEHPRVAIWINGLWVEVGGIQSIDNMGE